MIKEIKKIDIQSVNMEIPLKLERIIFCLTQENIDSSVNQTVKLFDTNFPYSFNIIIINLVYYAFYSQKNSCDVTLNYLELIQAKEVNINKKIPKIIDVFIKHISGIREQEAYYLLENIIKRNWANINIVKNIKTKYFAHYKTDKENKINANLIAETNFIENYEELSKNDFELHKQLIEEGHNPSEIAKIIRNDEIEKLQEISSQTNFDFNQKIEPSLYERCSFVNKENVSLIDFAAFFSSVKCFKYLLMNGANVENTGKYAVACGNEEILHLCEQNHSSFEDAYETAIKFHQNNILKYLYENKLIIDKLINFCIYYGNYETLSYLEKDFAKNDKIDIGKAAKTGNLYLVAYFLQHNQIPKDILIFSSSSDNIELLKIILEYEGIDINEQNKWGNTALMKASEKGHTEIVKILLEQEGIDINVKDNFGWTALMFSTSNGHTEIVKLLLQQKGIEINAKDSWGWTALIYASYKGHTDIVKLLLSQEGIDINVKENLNGETALVIASNYGDTEIVNLLLNHKKR